MLTVGTILWMITEGLLSVSCKTPEETGTVLQILREYGGTLHDHHYILAIADDPGGWDRTDAKYWRFTAVAFEPNIRAISLYSVEKPHASIKRIMPYEEFISTEELNAPLCREAMRPTGAEAMAAMFSD